MSDNEFESLVNKYLDGDASESEIARLHKAVADPDRRALFAQKMRMQVFLRDAMAEEAEIQSIHSTAIQDAAVQDAATQRKAVQGERGADQPRANPLSSRKWILGLAVGIAASFLAAWMLPSGLGSRPAFGTFLDISGAENVVVSSSKLTGGKWDGQNVSVGDTVHCDADTWAMLRLSDGSILSLEPNSKIALVSDRPRVELLQGEALFEIAPREDSMEPFEVVTGQSTVEVMGTVFTLESDQHTKLKVYEGRVVLTRHADNASVEVGTEQMATTENQDLIAENLSRSPSVPAASIISLLPTDDAGINWGRTENSEVLKVQKEGRTVYLRFMVPDVGKIQSARLRLTQHIDPGSGTLRFFRGQSSDWNESDLSEKSAPEKTELIAKRSGVVRRGQVIDVDVTKGISGPGAVTFIVTLDKANERDIWFGSKESNVPPQLILTCSP